MQCAKMKIHTKQHTHIYVLWHAISEITQFNIMNRMCGNVSGQ